MKIQGSTKVEVHYNGDFDVPQQIETFFQCGQCMDEMPEGISPANNARLNIGVSKKGDIQVWCVRHNINVVLLTLQAVELKH